MAEQSDDAEKTEEPTQRRLEQAHEKGDVAKSQEVSTWFVLAASTLVIGAAGTYGTGLLLPPLTGILEHSGTVALDSGALRRLLMELSTAVAVALAVPLAALMVAAVLGNVVQHKPLLSAEKIKPKLSKISPLAGAKRMFSAEALVNFAKGVIKIALISAVMTLVLWPERERLHAIAFMDLAGLMGVIQSLALTMLAAVLAVLAVVAALDFMWTKQRWIKRQRMTIREIREEYKQAEGDPHIKAKVRQIRLERSRRRMMAAVPEASVVITNPTHYAVALKYETGMQAPVCVAKGADAIALTIRETAKAHDVPIIENPPLARTLYAHVEIDETIPEEHYKAVAEVIGYVMSMRRKAGWRG